MARKETYYQVGICPHCPDHMRQEFVDGINEYSYEMLDQGKRYVYGDVHSLSFFRCDGCHAIVGYRTYYADAVDIEEAEKLDKKWVFQQDDSESDSYFKDHASLIYSTHKTDERELSAHVPEEIKSLYQRALKVKRIEPNSFAVQIRQALEAVCTDQGEPGKNLSADLRELSKRGVLPPTITEMAHKLRDSGNDGAHIRPQEVESYQVQSIDDFFHLIVNYVYDAPALLRSYRELLEIEVPEIIAGDHIN
jgi:hypothetical protein